MPRLNPRTFTILAAETIADDGVQWIEVMPTGEKLRNGRFYFTLTREDLDVYAASIRASGDRTPLDYDHSAAEGEGTRASGWFTGQAEVREDADRGPILWAQVQWTEAAVEAIKAREFRFISPEFSFAEKDSKTGLMTKAKAFVAATLTNRPFFDALNPVTAAVVWNVGEGLESLRERVNSALNPGPGDPRFWVSDIAPGKALVCEHGASRMWVVPFTDTDGEIEIAAASDWIEAMQEWVAAAAAAAASHQGRRPVTEGETMPDLKAIAVALGLPEDADEDTITAAADTLVRARHAAEAIAAEGVVITHEKLAELEASAVRGDSADKELKAMRISGLLDQAVRDGKIVPAQKESLTAWGTADYDALAAHIATTPEHSFKLTAVGNDDGDGGDGVTAEQAAEYTDGKVTVDADSLKLHNEAVAILTAAGKTDYTDGEYADALVTAERKLAAA